MEKRIKKVVEQQMPLASFLKNELHLTKRQIRQAKFREDGICINGTRARVTTEVSPGDVVEVLLEMDHNASDHLVSCDRKLSILYEDEDLIIVDKPAGIVVHPSHGHYGDSIANILMHYFRMKHERFCVRCVGRLDKDTSGILVFVKNQVAAGRLLKQKEAGIFQKEYLALVHGKLNETQGIIREKIGKIDGELMKMGVTSSGKHAVTHFQELKNMDLHSLVSLRLETGRTHQIRVHMAWAGHPLLGDPLYGTQETDMKRTALHAWKVVLKQPFTEKMIEVEAPIPEDMKYYLTIEKEV